MTEIDAALVRRKLGSILRNLEDLGAIEGLSLAEYRGDRFRQKGTERLLQEIVEAAADINAHLLRAAGAVPPPDYYVSFIQAGQRGIIPPTLAQQLAPSAGLRNRLVPEYDRIDDAIVLAAVGTARRQFKEFVGSVEAYLGKEGF